MKNEQLIDYIKKARQAGLNDEQIKSELANAGWQDMQINEALRPTPANTLALKKRSPKSKIIIIVSAVLLVDATIYGVYYFISVANQKNSGAIETAVEQKNSNTAESEKIANINTVSADTALNSNVDDPSKIDLLPDEIPAGFRLMSKDDAMAAEMYTQSGLSEIPGYITNKALIEDSSQYRNPDITKIKSIYLAPYINIKANQDALIIATVQYTSADDLALELKKISADPDDETVILYDKDIMVIIAVYIENDTAPDVRDALTKKLSKRLNLQELTSDEKIVTEDLNGISVRTYINDKFGYSFKFPSKWDLDYPETDAPGLRTSVMPLSSFFLAFSVTPGIQTEFKSLDAFKSELVKNGYKVEEKKVAFDTISVDALSAVMQKNHEQIYFFYKGTGYMIFVNHDVEDTKIPLSTFRLLK